MKRSLLSLALCAAVAVPAFAGAVRTVTVPGSARVQVLPNVAYLSVSVVDQRPVDPALPGKGPVAVAAALKQEHAPRVAEVKEALKALVGSQGAVTSTSQLVRDTKYDRQSGENEFVGYKLVTTIAVELRGRGAIEQKLDKLFDAATAKADHVDDPVLAVSDRSRAAAENRALKKAVANARKKAEAALEPGESLGKILDRVAAGAVPSPRPHRGAARAQAALESVPDVPQGGGLIETGKTWVSAAANFVFEVLGRPTRLSRP